MKTAGIVSTYRGTCLSPVAIEVLLVKRLFTA